MGWKSLGRDAVNSTTQPIEFVAREKQDKMVSFTMPHSQYEKVKAFAEESGLKVSQLCRYAIASEMRRGVS